MTAEIRLYDVLGVAPEVSAQEIRKAYRQLALKHHPDRGGDARVFQELSAAYEILSDPDRRQLYDRLGEKGCSRHLQGEQTPGSHPEGPPRSVFAADLLGGFFESLFGADGFLGSRPRASGTQAITCTLRVSLEELFTGTARKVVVKSRTAACDQCQGLEATSKLCSSCQGKGRRVFRRSLSPGFVQQVETQCPDCRGQGRSRSLPKDSCCYACHGSGQRQEQEVPLEVTVPAGARNGQSVVLLGAGHRPFKDQPAGNVVVLLQAQPHQCFERQGDDLLAAVKIPLADALGGGGAARLQHLDGRQLLLRPGPGEVIKPFSWRRVRGEGMPKIQATEGLMSISGRRRGDLFVRFEVVFPDRLDASTMKDLSAALKLERQWSWRPWAKTGEAGQAREVEAELEESDGPPQQGEGETLQAADAWYERSPHRVGSVVLLDPVSPSIALGALLAGAALLRKNARRLETARHVTKDEIWSLTAADLPNRWRPRISTSMARRNEVVKAITEQLDKSYFVMVFNRDLLLGSEVEVARQMFPETVLVRCLKNSLVQQAMKNTGWDNFSSTLQGSNMYIFVENDKDLKETIIAYTKMEKKFMRKDKLA
ncbi:unnamed protein product, partial [Polarella glacialis]